nr:MAG TPA: hypothetical protein [Caudoviricetes sp.]DAZ53717.1 MAG TPA: hypothetical protein [Caudoviricetes sp.]
MQRFKSKTEIFIEKSKVSKTAVKQCIYIYCLIVDRSMTK